MESIKQKAVALGAPALPDFRNLGVILRLLLAVNLLALLTVLLRNDEPARLAAELALMAGRVELPLLLAVLLLYLLGPVFARLAPRAALAALGGVLVLVVSLSYPLLAGTDGSLFRRLAWACGAAIVCLLYFDYRNRRYSPALAEARLQALSARIRPHFFFNSLNGVLGVIRSDPRRAERALEELCELFRVLMRDNRELVVLGDELALCERYLDLERLRLGERLAVRWQIEGEGAGLMGARVPPLLLQPLLENAVYYGVEPAPGPAEILVRIARRGDELRIEVDNPACDPGGHRAGNHMALDNIRERLMLFFDLEAGVDIDCSGGRYRVRLRLPFRSLTAS